MDESLVLNEPIATAFSTPGKLKSVAQVGSTRGRGLGRKDEGRRREQARGERAHAYMQT